MNALTVVAELIVKPGKEEQVRQELLKLIEPTRGEEGCLQYDLHVTTDEPGRFFFYENWTSRDHLDRHLQTPHLQALAAKADDLLSEPPRIVTCNRIA